MFLLLFFNLPHTLAHFVCGAEADLGLGLLPSSQEGMLLPTIDLGMTDGFREESAYQRETFGTHLADHLGVRYVVPRRRRICQPHQSICAPSRSLALAVG